MLKIKQIIKKKRKVWKLENSEIRIFPLGYYDIPLRVQTTIFNSESR
jgi:hypothetical protein